MYVHIYLSIDPGTNMLGTAINGITADGKWEILHVHTTNIGAILNHLYNPDEVNRIGLRFFRAKAVATVIEKLADSWEIQSAASESPYMGRFATAFAALTECMYAIRTGCYQYKPNMDLTTIDPATIKKAVGVPGNSGDKSKMTEAVRKLAGEFVNVDILDEHSIDAIAVGYCYYKTYFNK